MRHLFGMPKLYSYTRFSTPEQAEGDSERRQTESAAHFAAEKGLELDESLKIADLGVSAFRGANLAPDAGLGKFMEAVREGLVEPGSILLLESLDRFSRAEPLKVQHELTGLLLAGIRVATLTDGKVYSRDSLAQDNGLGLMVALMVAIRAHEESQTKGRRVAAAWSEKRRKIRAGEADRLTRKAPAWLRWGDEGWAVDEERADVVRRVFSLTLAGMGEASIARQFNEEGVEPLGRAKQWHRSSVSKLLRNRAVLGELTPGRIEYVNGKKRRVLEDPIPEAFPPIIAEADWLAVRSLKDGHAPAARGAGAGRPLANVLGGLARCPLCGSAMTRVMKGSGKKAGKPKLVCTKAKAGAGCTYHSVPLPEVEAALLHNPGRLLTDIPAGQESGELDKRALALENNIAGTVEHLTALADALEAAPSDAGAKRLACLEAELGTMQAVLADLEETRRLHDGGLIRARAERLYEAIEEAQEAGETFEDRGPINAALKVLFDGVTVDYPKGDLVFRWRQGGESRLKFAWPEDSKSTG